MENFIMLVKIVNYPAKDILSVFAVCFRGSLLAFPLPIVTFIMLQGEEFNDILKFAIKIPLSVLSVCTAIWFVGLTPEMKEFIKQIIWKVLKKHT